MWGANFTVLKTALGQFDVLAFSFLRYAGMMVLAWTVVVLREPGRPGIAPGSGARMAAAGLVGYSGYILLSLVGLAFTTAFSTAILIATAPVFSAVLLWAWRTEAVGRTRAAGLALSLLGVALFVAGKPGHGLGSAGLGDLISLAAAALYGAYTVIVKPLLARHPATVVTAWTLTIGGLPVLLFAAPSLLHQDWARITGSGWLILAWSIVVPVYLAWTLWSWASARAGVAATNAFLYLVPVVGGIVSFAVLGEGFGAAKLAGAAVVLAGLALVRRQRPATARPEAARAA